jgi:hypothetical protein
LQSWNFGIDRFSTKKLTVFLFGLYLNFFLGGAPTQVTNHLSQYYRCPERFVHLDHPSALEGKDGYFKFGPNTMCYGREAGRIPSASPRGRLHDALSDTAAEGGVTKLPFDPNEVADNLRFERYVHSNADGTSMGTVARRSYYFVRPLLPVRVRKHIQKIHLTGWDRLEFPRWPVDRSVDNLFENLMLQTLRSQELEEIPFIWFWPEGASSCAIMTHDVETGEGRDFSSSLMDINDSFGIKSSFQVVPEKRYEVPESYLTAIRDRDFEVNVQDLNHDGLLFSTREKFLSRVKKINAYGKQFKSDGFRSAILYRQQDWYDALDFSYDMSVPNVAHLDPQRGGCCTVMPYFVGKILELPVTTTQDYTLFHILNEHSIDLWRQQSELIMQKHGLISFIVHPDYITQSAERNTYEKLLEYLVELRETKNVWVPKPGDANQWWRQRDAMTLVEGAEGWRVEGHGKERARVAYASEKNGRIEYTLSRPAAVPELTRHNSRGL